MEIKFRYNYTTAHCPNYSLYSVPFFLVPSASPSGGVVVSLLAAASFFPGSGCSSVWYLFHAGCLAMMALSTAKTGAAIRSSSMAM